MKELSRAESSKEEQGRVAEEKKGSSNSINAMFTAQLQAQTHHPRPALQVPGTAQETFTDKINIKD